MTVLLRRNPETYPPVLDAQMSVRPGDVDGAGDDGVAITSSPNLERRGPTQDLREHAGAGRRQVEHHEDRSGQIPGELLDQPLQPFDPTGRRSDHHEGDGRGHVRCTSRRHRMSIATMRLNARIVVSMAATGGPSIEACTIRPPAAPEKHSPIDTMTSARRRTSGLQYRRPFLQVAVERSSSTYPSTSKESRTRPPAERSRTAAAPARTRSERTRARRARVTRRWECRQRRRAWSAAAAARRWTSSSRSVLWRSVRTCATWSVPSPSTAPPRG